jgi:hypothetical protein
MEDAARYAYEETKLIHRPWKAFSPRATKRAQTYPLEWLEDRGEELFITKEQTFRASNDVQENIRAWNAYQKSLRKNFSSACRWWQKKPAEYRPTYGSIYRKECDVRIKEDIIPPIYERSEKRSHEASFTDDVEFEHPYRAPIPRIDLRIFKAGLDQTSYPRRMGITDKLHIGAKDTIGRKKGPAQRAITLRHLYGTGKVPLRFWNLYLVPAQETFQYWHNPFGVGAVADSWARNYNSYVPHYISEGKKELLDLRKEYYGRDLLWHEWMQVGRLHPADITILHLLKECIQEVHFTTDKCEKLEIFVQDLVKYPGLGNYLESLKSLTPDAIADLFEKWQIALLSILRLSKPKKNEEEEFFERERKIFEVFEDLDKNPQGDKWLIDEFY